MKHTLWYEVERQALETPHLEVQVQGFKGSIHPKSETEPEDVGLIRNCCLFSLGIVLIELAYQAPLHELSQRMTIPNNLIQAHKEVLIANRLGKIIDNMLGSTYADVVQKCLSCDFGQGDDQRWPNTIRIVFGGSPIQIFKKSGNSAGIRILFANIRTKISTKAGGNEIRPTFRTPKNTPNCAIYNNSNIDFLTKLFDYKVLEKKLIN